MPNSFIGDSTCKALWRMENGLLTLDSIGGNTLTNNNVVTNDTVNFKEGLASADFEFASSNYFSITDANYIGPLKNGDTDKEITICSWIKPESLPASDECIFSKWEVNKKSIICGIKSTKEPTLWIGHTNGTGQLLYSHASQLVVGQWYHIGMTYRDSDRSYRIRVWDDTAQTILGIDKTGTSSEAITVSDATVALGRTAAGFLQYDGLIDEIPVFNSIKTPAEIDLIRKGLYGWSSSIPTTYTIPTIPTL